MEAHVTVLVVEPIVVVVLVTLEDIVEAVRYLTILIPLISNCDSFCNVHVSFMGAKMFNCGNEKKALTM
jgi:hypothetical protein